MTFQTHVVAPVREHMGRPVRLPATGTWSLERDRGASVLRLELPADSLARNLQTNHAAAPFFLLCFAYWYSRITGVEPHLRLDVTGAAPVAAGPLRHHRRAWIALEALEAALGDRLSVTGAPLARWPDSPVINAPLVDRASADGSGGGPEHRVEVALTADPAHAAAFSTLHAPIAGFRRQLPLGLFEGSVARSNHFTPGQGAQADLWATSPDGDVFHLFELKVAGNTLVGVLPELLTYAWLLHRARVGLPDGTPIAGGGPGVEAARAAERIACWIVAPALHPLVEHDAHGPLEWLNAGLAPELSFGVAPFVEGGATGFLRWTT